MENRGTPAYSLGQFAYVNAAVTKALPKALAGTNPGEVARAIQHGEDLEMFLSDAFRSLLQPWRAVGHTLTYKMPGDRRWELLEDVHEPRTISIPNLKLVSFIEPGESISAEELVHRTKEGGGTVLGQRHAELLLEYKEEIPDGFENYRLFFPGTIWLDSVGHRYIPYLDYGHIFPVPNVKPSWELGLYGLALNWTSKCRVVRSRG